MSANRSSLVVILHWKALDPYNVSVTLHGKFSFPTNWTTHASLRSPRSYSCFSAPPELQVMPPGQTRKLNYQMRAVSIALGASRVDHFIGIEGHTSRLHYRRSLLQANILQSYLCFHLPAYNSHNSTSLLWHVCEIICAVTSPDKRLWPKPFPAVSQPPRWFLLLLPGCIFSLHMALIHLSLTPRSTCNSGTEISRCGKKAILWVCDMSVQRVKT